MSINKGQNFELVIQAVLNTLTKRHKKFVTVEYHPEISLDSGRVIIPDFDLHVNLIFEEARYLIECQDRNKYSLGIVDKISRVKAQSNRNRFIFVAGSDLPKAVNKALKKDGVITMRLDEFVDYIIRMDEVLAAIQQSGILNHGIDPKPFLKAVDAWLRGKKVRHPLHGAIQIYQQSNPSINPQVSGARLAKEREYLPDEQRAFFDMIEGSVLSQVHPYLIERKKSDSRITIASWESTNAAYDYWYCLLFQRCPSSSWY
jgi:hypothetical protein